MAGEREKCLAAGCTDYLPKPLDRDQLLRTLRKYLSPAASPETPEPRRPEPAVSD
jgi:CheY-like chemotaxis protein